MRTLSTSIEEITGKLDKAKEQYEIDDGVLLIEELYGIAFVVAQTYLAGTIADANRISQSTDKIKKEVLLKRYNDKLDGHDISKLELCDAMANFYKHREEWTDWSIPGRHQKIVSILHELSIDQFEIIPFDKVMGMLWPGNNDVNFEPLLSLISDWRTKVIQSCLKEKNA
jgi:hypothetical protein